MTPRNRTTIVLKKIIFKFLEKCCNIYRMGINLSFTHPDLVTPDGKIVSIERCDDHAVMAQVLIEEVSPFFVGFALPPEKTLFNLKSTLAQLGIHAYKEGMDLSSTLRTAEIKVKLEALNELGVELLKHITTDAYIGKLFAADDSRRVRDPGYLSRMFGRTDRRGRPLLSLGEKHDRSDIKLEKFDGRTIAFLSLKTGTYFYDNSIKGIIPTLAKALTEPQIKIREFLHLTQTHDPNAPRKVCPGELLLVKTIPLHIRTVFARVVDDLLPKGFTHTSASVLQPDTFASGDIYELYGSSDETLDTIPLEFYTLSPYREHVFFSDRDQLQTSIEDPETLFQAMKTAPGPLHHKCSTFVVKGDQLLNLKNSDWIQAKPDFQPFPGFFHPDQQGEKVEAYLHAQPSYPFLEAIEHGVITSQGILLSRYFPSPIMKRMLISEQVHRCLKGIYFQYPSRSHGEFFSHEDRSMLIDLAKFGLRVFWLDKRTHQIMQYVPRPDKDSGMFVPIPKVETFINATMVGIYGSNLVEGPYDSLLKELMEGLLARKEEMDHPLLNPKTPLALVTGGGPGVMSIGNQISKDLGLLSCANIIDFRSNGETVANEQQQNPYIEAKMTYRLERLVERQAEFHLDLPIFLTGGIGTDFEYTLEEVHRKTGATQITPVLLIGDPAYWKQKVSSRFLTNLETGTIKGSEWVSNCFYCVQTARQGLKVYEDFFSRKLPIGPKGPIYREGFVTL